MPGFKVVGAESKGTARTKAGDGWTVEEAEVQCKQANEQAEKLGIKTRYEVAPC